MKGELSAATETGEFGGARSMPTTRAGSVARTRGARGDAAGAVASASGTPNGIAGDVARVSGARNDVASGVARAAAVAAAVLAIAGCASSAPLRFYTLSAAPAATGDGGAAGAMAIRVGRVRIPAELDRMEIVQRVDANRVNIGELDRWAAPLEDMVRRALTANLQVGAAGAVSGGQGQAPATLNVDIEEFMGDASCNVTLTASWELKGSAPQAAASSGSGGDASSPAARSGAEAGGTAAPRSGRETIRVAGTGGACPASALPLPMSQALGQLSERILARR